MFILVFAWITAAGHFVTSQFCADDAQCAAALGQLKADHYDALDTRWAVLQPDFQPAQPAQPKGSI